MSNNTTYSPADMWANIQLSMNAVRSVLHTRRLEWLNSDDEDVMRACNAYRAQRMWVAEQMERFTLHPVIKACIDVCRPNDWHQLFLEWPHISEGDRTRIAYTQNEDKGRRNLQTVTSVGKYLTRHFNLPDHTIRDLVARYGSAASFKFVHTTAEMIYHLHKGPGSCMVWREDRGVPCRDGVTRHPYEAYNPKYGWHMAVRIEGDDTVGRALCMTNSDGHKYFVRTYARPANAGGYSETDNAMENWLREQGYVKESSWQDGEKLAYYETSGDFLAPYLDGGDKRVSLHSDEDEHWVMVDSDGEYACDQTGGAPTTLDDDGNNFECEDCGDDTDDDDGYWVGYNDDSHVCVSCYENNYVYGYGRNGRQYSFNSEDAVYIESQSEYYHQDYLDANEIVYLECGEYESIDNAIEIDGDWYHLDDDRICRTTDTDEYLLCDNGCWQCEESGNWYTDSVDYVEVDDKKYHPSRAPATDDEDDSDGDTAVAVAPVVTTPATTVVPKQLTMEMLNECALVEEHCPITQRVTYSIRIMHNGNMFIASRTYRDGFIESQGVDWMRVNVRRIISNELLGVPASTFDSI